MPWGPRVTETSPIIAEGDKLYWNFQYSGVSGSLTAFMPVFKDLSDAAEYDSINNTTALVAPAVPVGKQSAGKATIGTDFNAGATQAAGFAPIPVGVYSPGNPTDRPSTGDLIRVMRTGGISPVQISSGQTANIGDFIVVQNNQALAFTVPATTQGNVSLGQAAIGRVVAFGNQISVGAAPTQTRMPGGFGFLINGWIGPNVS